MEKLTEQELKKYEELEKKHLGDFDKKTGIYYEHEDTLSKNALISRFAEQNRIQAEKDRLYDLENTTDESVIFNWD